MDAYKLHIKLGEAEFNAEGPQEIVQKAFEKFLAATEKVPDSAQNPKDQHSDGSHKTGSLDPAILNRAYTVDGRRKFVSLRVLPAEDRTRRAMLRFWSCMGIRTCFRWSKCRLRGSRRGCVS